MTATEPKHVLTLERTLDAPVENIWRCWSEPELLAQFLCPKPWSASDVRIDLTPGGEFFFVMHGPEGERFEQPGVILAAEARRRLVWTDAFRHGWIPGERAFMAAHITFEPLDGGRTRYVARAMHWSEETLKQHEEMGFHGGWGTMAAQLEALAQTL